MASPPHADPRFDALLAYIEDELDPASRRAIDEQLQSDPRLAAAIEAMRQDRDGLRSMPEPDLPEDLIESLEPLLARPMLMEPPGAARRRQQPARWPKYAAAATVAALVGGAAFGAWFTGLVDGEQIRTHARAWAPWVDDGPATGGPAGERMDENDRGAPTDGADQWPGADALAVDGGGPVHHLGPDAAWPLPAGPGGGSERGAPDAPGFRSADVVLVIASDDPQRITDDLVAIAGRVSGPVALVENFSYDEAERLGMAALAQSARQRAAERTRARSERAGSERAGSGRVGGLTMPDDRRSRGPETDPKIDAGKVSEQLLGAPEHAPDLEQQLVFSESGAALTISVPAGRLGEVLAAIDRHDACRTWLRPAEVGGDGEGDGEVDGEPASPSATWLEGGRRLRGLLAGLPDDAIVHLPVAVTREP